MPAYLPAIISKFISLPFVMQSVSRGHGREQGCGGGQGHVGMNSASTQHPGEQEQYKYCALVHNYYYE